MATPLLLLIQKPETFQSVSSSASNLTLVVLQFDSAVATLLFMLEIIKYHGMEVSE